MARKVDIRWTNGGRLKASMRWANKRGRITFFLIPAPLAKCSRCPFEGLPACGKWRRNRKLAMCLCNSLWNMPGDNKFENREEIGGWQPLGPIGREKKKK